MASVLLRKSNKIRGKVVFTDEFLYVAEKGNPVDKERKTTGLGFILRWLSYLPVCPGAALGIFDY